jgi:hypothetical protein
VGLKSLVNALFVLLIEGPAPKGPGLPEQLRLQLQNNPLYKVAQVGIVSRQRSGLVKGGLTEEARQLFNGMPYEDLARQLAEIDDVLAGQDAARERASPEALVGKLKQGETVYYVLETEELGLLFGGNAGIRGKDSLWLVLKNGPGGTVRIESSEYRNHAVYS